MTFTAMPAQAGVHVCSEGNGGISREAITLKAGSGVLVAGSVLGRITTAGADLGKYALYDNAASNGTQVAVGALFDGVDASGAADVHGVAHVRLCELYADRLTFKAGATDADKTAAYTDLATASVVMR
jgi:hypothetical protein